MLITADLHLTDRPADDYRWSIFGWLRAAAEKRGLDQCFILGDLTHQKNRHSAVLVNRLVEELEGLAGQCEVWILKGNHDFDDPEHPFFRFLSRLERVHFISKPMRWGRDVLFLPYTKHYTDEWKEYDLSSVDYVMMHQPVEGARTENGYKVQGVPRSVFKDAHMVVSGDIHVPQKIGNVTYVGAPYPIRFGDPFQPRCLYVNGAGALKSIRRRTIRKEMITIADTAELDRTDVQAGDMVRITVRIPRSEFVEWPSIREAVRAWASKRGIVLCGLELKERGRRVRIAEMESAGAQSLQHEDVYARYCEEQELDESLVKAGQEFIK